MRRRLPWIVVAIVALIVAATLLRRQPPPLSDAEINTEGHFASDSLGVSLMLPRSSGWRFAKEAPVPGGAYIAARHESGNSIVRLFASPNDGERQLAEVESNRRAQLATLFGVTDLADVIDQVLQEEHNDVAGYPAIQWQAFTKTLGAPGEPTHRIMFLWIATVQPEWVFECLGMIFFPADPTPAERAEYDVLLRDTGFIVQSLRVR